MNNNRTNGKSSQPEQSNLDSGASPAPVGADSPRRRAETKLEFPTGEPDLEALRAVTWEWLVPVLVEKFLREHGVELQVRPDAGGGKSPISDL